MANPSAEKTDGNMIAQISRIIVCPECKAKIGVIVRIHQVLGFFCQACNLVYPVKDDILILLPKDARNHELEYDLVQSIKESLSRKPNAQLQECFDNTLRLLHSRKGIKNWEWEDEEHWREEYKTEAKASVEKNWNDRIWQREFLLTNLLHETGLTGKTILDVGCGEGQNFRFLLGPHCDETSLYVAADVSFDGLKLNRLRNWHKNSIYVLCSADRLPFQEEIVDILCYFGILHHTERKAATIPENIRLLKKTGYILLAETLDHKKLSNFLPDFLLPKSKSSAHEGLIDKKDLFTNINSAVYVEIIASREMCSLFYVMSMRFFRNFMLNHKSYFNSISAIDTFLVRSFGRVIPLVFRAGEIMLLLRKQYETNIQHGDRRQL